MFFFLVFSPVFFGEQGVGQVEEQGAEEGLHQIPPDDYAQCLADALAHELADALVHESRLCCQGWERTKVLQQIA